MICLDTNVVIWGVQGVARSDQIGMIERTRRYLRYLSDENEKVMVPSVVVGEYLQRFPEEEHPQQLEVLSANFFLPPFDVKCAALASQLQNVGVLSPRVPGARNALKADCQIIATAICHGAKLIVTSNVEEYVRIAQGRIPVSDVPQVMEQVDLLGEDQQADD